jgi:hypothetical protein
MLVENLGADVNWMEPRDLSFRDMDFAINSPRGASSKYGNAAVVMLDEAVYRLKSNITPETFRALLTIRGGETIRMDESRGWELLPRGRQEP